MNIKDARIAIVGIGIIGITTAIELLRNGISVTVFSEDEPLKTNSDSAVALWYAPPYDKKPLLYQLCYESLNRYRDLAFNPDSGVEELYVNHYFKSIEKLNQFKKYNKDRLVESSADSYKSNEFMFQATMKTYLFDPMIYRQFLLNYFYQLGGELVIRTISSLHELKSIYDAIVNCAGWKANRFFQDKKLYPLRGHVLIAKTSTNLARLQSFSVPSLHTYFIVRKKSNVCLIGTTHQKGQTDLSLTKDSINTCSEILRKAYLFLPKNVELKVEKIKVGIRSGRTEAILHSEWKVVKGKKCLIVHCYGHGGSGYSASWGSAQRILAILYTSFTLKN